MLRLFSFVLILAIIGFASGYTVFAQTLGQHEQQHETAQPGESSGGAAGVTDCIKIEDKKGTKDLNINADQKNKDPSKGVILE